jgi:hypothetical protein
MQKHTPINFSDYALVYGSQACGLLAAWMTFESGADFLDVIVGGCNGLILGTFLLLTGLIIVRQPPAVLTRIANGEPVDPPKESEKGKGKDKEL